MMFPGCRRKYPCPRALEYCQRFLLCLHDTSFIAWIGSSVITCTMILPGHSISQAAQQGGKISWNSNLDKQQFSDQALRNRNQSKSKSYKAVFLRPCTESKDQLTCKLQQVHCPHFLMFGICAHLCCVHNSCFPSRQSVGKHMPAPFGSLCCADPTASHWIMPDIFLRFLHFWCQRTILLEQLVDSVRVVP